MSLDQVRARTTEIELRLRSLSAGGRTGGTLGAAGPAADAFAGQLQAAAVRTATSPSAAAPVLRPPSASSAPVLRGSGTSTGSDLVATAESRAGTPYVWGGESMAEGGFDCSGLMQWAYKQHGIDLPRVSADQAKVGRAVSAAEARPGDLVFFDHSGRPDHIGMYAGNGEWIVAPKTGDVVKRQKVDLSEAATIRRVLPDAGPSALRGSAAPAWSRGLPAAGQRFAPLVQAAADKAGIDPRLLASLAWSESGFDPSARSGAGAQGLVQLMPATARGLGVTDTSDPAQSLAGGATYLKQQLDAFGGDPALALAAYNAGPTAVRRHGGIPPYAETQKYVTTVLDRFRSLGGTP